MNVESCFDLQVKLLSKGVAGLKYSLTSYAILNNIFTRDLALEYRFTPVSGKLPFGNLKLCTTVKSKLNSAPIATY